MADSKEKPIIIFLHEPQRGTDDYHYTIYLVRRPRCSELICLPYAVERYGDMCVIAGVRPHKQPQSSGSRSFRFPDFWTHDLSARFGFSKRAFLL